MPPSERDWVRDQQRFVADANREGGLVRDHGAPLGPLAQQFATLTYSLLDADTVGDVLEQVVDATSKVVPGADLVSVTLRSPDGRFHTPVHTDPVAAELDEVQYRLTEGPCLTAAEPSGPAVAISDDLSTDTQWPRFAPVAAQHGFASMCSTALLPGATQSPNLSGALNIYSRQLGGLTEDARALALLLATHASLALAHSAAVEQSELKVTQLRRAIDSRDVIGQAKGIVMARRGLSPDEAFAFLRTTSQHLNVKLVELAETLATRFQELDSPDDHRHDDPSG